MIVAIDGPAGSGKSTVAREVARRLGFNYLDSGALYRTVALLAVERRVELGDGLRIGGLAAGTAIEMRAGEADGLPRIVADGRDVSDAIRTPEITEASSRVAAHPEVRKALLEKQRSIIRTGDHVVEGRDIGTVVAPDAPVKFFLDATPEERARRRVSELERRGHRAEADAVRAAIAARDIRDSTRATAPLRPAPDAIVIDTTALSVEQVIDRVIERVGRTRVAEER
jgi:cytidylate kinase